MSGECSIDGCEKPVQGSEAVGLLRAANILRAASGERIGAAGYTQEDQDNLGQCGR